MTAPHLPRAYVLDSDPQALSVVRNLGRHGVPVTVLTYKPHSPGAHSRFAETHVLPRIDEHEQLWLSHLVHEGRRSPHDSVLIPCTDRFVEFVSRNRGLLSPFYRIPLPSGSILERIMDKRTQYQLAKGAGVPIPTTLFPKTDVELERLCRTGWPFPCIMKPVKPHRWIRSYQNGYKLLIARSYEELLSGFRDARARGLDVIVQERIPGDESTLYSLYFYSNAKGELLGAGVGRKLRQFPPGMGNGTLRETVDEPRVIELGRRVVRACAFHGSGNVEFRKDARDGEFKLMELNTRTALGEEVVIAGGLSLPYAAYCDLIGRPLPIALGCRAGVKWWYLETDFRAFKEYRRQGVLSLWGWIRSILGARSFAHFAWDDLTPFLVAMRTFVWKLRTGAI